MGRARESNARCRTPAGHRRRQISLRWAGGPHAPCPDNLPPPPQQANNPPSLPHLSPPPTHTPAQMASQARQVLAACERSPQDAVALDYDPRNPFDLCSLTWKPIYRGSRYVEDPYTHARFAPECEGQISPVGGLSRIGAEATGLVVSRSQIR